MCRIPKSTRNLHKEKERYFEAVSKFDSIFIEEDRKKKSVFNSNLDSRIAKSHLKKEDITVSKSSSNSKSNYSASQSSAFFINK
jgi:hypothetical protein